MPEYQYSQAIVAGAVVIAEDGRVMLVLRSYEEEILPGYWELPSGKLEDFEQPEAAAKREVREETGLEIEIIRPLSPFAYTVRTAATNRHTVQVTYLARVSGGEPRPSDEHSAIAWVSPSVLDLFDMTEETSKLVQEALQAL